MVHVRQLIMQVDEYLQGCVFVLVAWGWVEPSVLKCVCTHVFGLCSSVKTSVDYNDDDPTGHSPNPALLYEFHVLAHDFT